MLTQLLTFISTLNFLALAAPSAQAPWYQGGLANCDNQINNPECPTLNFATFGDSWASGEAYSTATQYDSNKDNCHRVSHAWGRQMQDDSTWTSGPRDHQFVACSGSQFHNISDINTDEKYRQMAKLSKDINLMTLTVGGKNIGFAGIAEACYVKFFNQDDTACNDLSFGAIPGWLGGRQPKLSQELRRALNGLVDAINSQYYWAVWDVNVLDGYRHPSGSNDHYVDVSPQFEGHRFCEPGKSKDDNYHSDDVWLWNLSTDVPQDKNNQDWPNGPGQETDKIQALIAQGGLGTFDSSGSGGSGGIGTPMFHPKEAGHTAIKDQVLNAIRGAGIAGIVKPDPPKQ
ncbi:SGNH hydrolase [Microthyrium microscopicum]|uniref:SGNH hydrolase n=1 Tax=Microthyrium microscopicum TaxID=703497 RepID=A0A6A6U1D5_9PEZI|nr:SGNH hydrolase [Microthyrium microscopicum]